MSQLEKIEKICLDYLASSEDPWVPVSKLCERCKDIIGVGVSDKIVVEFVAHHPEIIFFNIASVGDVEFEEYVKRKGIRLEPFVILKSRMPVKRDLLKWMDKHIDSLIKTLENLLLSESSNDKKEEIKRLIDRANSVKRRINFYLSKNSKENV